MGVYGHELGAKERANLGDRARRSRPQQIRRPRNQSEVERNKALLARKVLVRGRFDRIGREVWDVVEVLGGKAEKVYAAGIRDFGEALEMGVACRQGRVMISMGFSRTEVKVAGSGILIPSKEIHPAKERIPYRPVGGSPRTFEVGDA